MSRRRYFWSLLRRSLLERKGSVLVTLLTVALGSSVVAAFLTLYSDVESKMSRELRAYGANLVLRPEAEGSHLADDALAALRAEVPAWRLVGAQSFLYGIATLEKDRVTVAGIDFDAIRSTTPYWQVVSGGIPGREDTGVCLLGKDAAARLRAEVGKDLRLEAEKNAASCRVAALVETGGAEDEQVFLPLDAARDLFGRPGETDLVLASVVGDLETVEGIAGRVARRIAGGHAEPIRKLSHSEGAVLSTIRSLVWVVVVFIALSTFLGLLIALTAMVEERRKELSLEKALGATDRSVALRLLTEVGLTALAGGVLGLGAGHVMADLMERTIFGTAVSFHPWLVPVVIVTALGVSLAGASIPLRAVAALQPAVVLKGE